MAYYFAHYDRIAPAADKAMAVLFNASSTVDLRLKRVYVYNAQVAGVAGVILDNEMVFITSATGGTVVTKRQFDSGDSAPNTLTTASQNSTVVESWSYKSLPHTNEEATLLGAQSFEDLLANNTRDYQLVYESVSGTKDLTFHQNQGISIENRTSSTLGTISTIMEWEEVANGTVQDEPATFISTHDNTVATTTIGDKVILFNTGSSTVTVHQIRKWNWNITAATVVTPSDSEFLLKRVNISVNGTGTNVMQPHDSADTLPNGVISATSFSGWTYSTVNTLKRFVMPSANVAIGAVTGQNSLSRNNRFSMLYDKEYGTKPITLRQNEGLVVELVTASTELSYISIQFLITVE